MRRIKYSLLAGLIFVFEWNLKSQEIVNPGEKNGAYESEYYYAFTEATKHMIYQNYAQAVSLYQRCLEYNPNSPAIRYQLSVINFKLGDINKAKKLGKEACALDNKNRWYLLNLINLYQTTNQLDSAVTFTRDLIRLEPENLENQFNLAILYQIMGEYKKALDVYNKLEYEYGRNNEIYINKYKIYRNSGNIKKAQQQLDYAHYLAPDDMNIMGLMAEHYRDIGKESEAENYYNILLKEGSSNGVAVFSYINYLVKFGQYDKALNYFVSSIRKEDIQKDQIFGYFINELQNNDVNDKHYAFLDTAMGYFYKENRDDFRISGLYVDYQMKRENFRRASLILKEMLTGNERNFKIWEQILYAENAMNHPDSVVKYGEALIKIFDYEALPYLYTGIAWQQLRNADKAIRLFEKGMRLTENNNILVQFYIYLAEACNEANDVDKSFEYYEKALAIDNDNRLVLNNYAYFLALADRDLEKAEKMSKYTVSEEKKNYVYLDTYGWILYKMNRESKAKRYIRRARRYGGSKSSEVMDHYKTLMGQ